MVKLEESNCLSGVGCGSEVSMRNDDSDEDVVIVYRGGWKSVNVRMGKVASSQVKKRFA